MLRLLSWKLKHNVSDNAFTELLPLVIPEPSRRLSLYAVKKLATTISNVKTVALHCCINSCVAFTGAYIDLKNCPHCGEPRLTSFDQPRKIYNIMPLIPRLRQQYGHPKRSEQLRYRAQQGLDPEGRLRDIFDGDRYKVLRDRGFFPADQDVALGMSTDGFQIYQQKTHDCWPIVLINLNLHPEDRVKKENMLLYGIIPGPRQPQDFNSFLHPLVDELLELEGGVECYDGLTKERFSLRAHLLFVSGDMPALKKVSGLGASNGVHPCRFCEIGGIYSSCHKHYYYPLLPPEGTTGKTTYNPDNLPMRSHEAIVHQAEIIDGTQQQKQRERLRTDTGM
jgi:Transposase family tnp2